MQKTLTGLAATLAASVALLSFGAHAQVSKAASEASDAAEHKIEQKRAEDKAKNSGPVGKVVNGAKADYHKSRSENSANKAKKSLDNATK